MERGRAPAWLAVVAGEAITADVAAIPCECGAR